MSKYWFGRHAPEHADAWYEFYKGVIHKGALDAKTKALIGVAAGVLLRCQHCAEAYARRATRAGASPQEIAESITMAAMVSSGSQLFGLDDIEKMLGGDE
jgi:AhpD family alkylhydroperoxidase